MSDQQHRRWKTLGVGVAIAVAVLVLVMALSGRKDDGRHLPPPAPEKIPSEAELALIAPLTSGAQLDDYTLRELHPIETNGYLRLVFFRDAAIVQLDIALAGSGTRAMATNGPYAVFYSVKDAPDADGQRMAKSLAARLHADLPPPAGMIVFVPHAPDAGP